MTRLFICCLFLLTTNVSKAQSSQKRDSTGVEISDKTFTLVEVESTFPGGNQAWVEFLGHDLIYPKKAVRKKIEGQVVARFIVDIDGSLTDIEVVSGPPELSDVVINALKKSPAWNPAYQNGKKVKSYKSLPINFKLPD